MKKLYFLFFLISTLSFSQQAYYNGIDFGQTGLDLKDDLATLIISTHTNTLSYGWDAVQATDVNPTNSSNVLLIYGWEDGSNGDCTDDLERSISSNGGSNCDYNREHTYPNSLGTPDLDTGGENMTAYSDAHNLRASDVQRNGQRGNQLFADGSGNSGNVTGGWYPGDATTGGTDWRGDVARVIMYMYLRYGSQCLPTNVGVGSSTGTPDDMIDLFLEWNAEDPPSDYETQRNTYHENTSNTYAQGNRNPFIDNPRLATVIWGGPTALDTWGIFTTDTEAPTVPTNVMVSNETSSTIDLSWTASTDNVGVTEYDVFVDASFYATVMTTSITVTGLSSETTYAFSVLARDDADNESAQSTPVNGTTTAASSGGVDLFFSEYLEGSGNNKALEIANVTGNSVDLSDYSVRLSSNGNASWTATYNFPSQSLANDDVFVIGHSSLAICTSVVDESNGTITGFNGNDAIGLFKNGTLIDILGELGNGTTFAENVTLVRKPTISPPVTVFDISEWDSYAQNTCTDLGSHTATLSTNDFSLSNLKIYPNPVKNNRLNFSTSQNLNVVFYDVLGKQVLNASVTLSKNYINIENLKKGIYIVKITSDQGSITKKLIRQ